MRSKQKDKTKQYVRTFIFISIFSAPEEGLSSNRNIGQFVEI